MIFLEQLNLQRVSVVQDNRSLVSVANKRLIQEQFDSRPKLLRTTPKITKKKIKQVNINFKLIEII